MSLFYLFGLNVVFSSMSILRVNLSWNINKIKKWQSCLTTIQDNMGMLPIVMPLKTYDIVVEFVSYLAKCVVKHDNEIVLHNDEFFKNIINNNFIFRNNKFSFISHTIIHEMIQKGYNVSISLIIFIKKNCLSPHEMTLSTMSSYNDDICKKQKQIGSKFELIPLCCHIVDFYVTARINTITFTTNLMNLGSQYIKTVLAIPSFLLRLKCLKNIGNLVELESSKNLKSLQNLQIEKLCMCDNLVTANFDDIKKIALQFGNFPGCTKHKTHIETRVLSWFTYYDTKQKEKVIPPFATLTSNNIHVQFYNGSQFAIGKLYTLKAVAGNYLCEVPYDCIAENKNMAILMFPHYNDNLVLSGVVIQMYDAPFF